AGPEVDAVTGEIRERRAVGVRDRRAPADRNRPGVGRDNADEEDENPGEKPRAQNARGSPTAVASHSACSPLRRKGHRPRAAGHSRYESARPTAIKGAVHVRSYRGIA